MLKNFLKKKFTNENFLLELTKDHQDYNWLKEAIDTKSIDINYQDKNNNTFLMICLKKNKFRSFLWLLENGADPTLKNNVVVGSGAQVLGPVIVGEFAKIGANAVVTRDVPEHAIMVGVPAKNIKTKPEIKDTSFKPYGISDEDDIPAC